MMSKTEPPLVRFNGLHLLDFLCCVGKPFSHIPFLSEASAALQQGNQPCEAAAALSKTGISNIGKTMSGITDLQRLLQSMSPQLVEGEFVFCTIEGALPDYVHLDPIATFREQEGLTLVLEAQQAHNAGFKTESRFCLITLTVHSSLEAVGLTAAFANKLASYGISANVIAGYYHDHIFVPKAQAKAAMSALAEFASR